jgi:trk system potassium uptake protein TrkA
MNIVIAGLGEVGHHVAHTLSMEGHHLTVIDNQQSAIERAEEALDALTLLGQADSPQVLKQAGVADAGLFVALTAEGSTNLLAALHAKRLGAQQTVARVSDSHFFESEQGVYQDYMGIDLVVNEKYVVASELERLVRAHAASAIEAFAHQKIEMLQLDVNEDGPGVNKPLGDINVPDGAKITAILRRDTLLVPNLTDMIQIGDAVVVVAKTSAVSEVERLFARERHHSESRAFIIGGGAIGLSLAKRLEREGTDVVVVEQDEERCQELSVALTDAQVLHGDGTNVHMLEEAGIASADVMCAVSGLDEVNLMAGLLAKDLGVRRRIILVRRTDYVEICKRLGLEHSLSPRLLVGREILNQLHNDDLVRDVGVLSNLGRVMEILVGLNSPVVGRQIQDIGLPRSAVPCLIISHGDITVPSADTVLNTGDRLLLFAPQDALKKVSKVFRVKLGAPQ